MTEWSVFDLEFTGLLNDASFIQAKRENERESIKPEKETKSKHFDDPSHFAYSLHTWPQVCYNQSWHNKLV